MDIKETLCPEGQVITKRFKEEEEGVINCVTCSPWGHKMRTRQGSLLEGDWEDLYLLLELNQSTEALYSL